jgi:hypothetical protein
MTTARSRIVNGAQVRAARAMLGWRRRDLAAAAGLHPNAVAYWERQGDIMAGGIEPIGCCRIRQACERAGIVFIADLGPGVLLTTSDRCA